MNQFRMLAMELEGVLCDTDPNLGPGFDEVCRNTIERVQAALLIMETELLPKLKAAGISLE